MSLIHQALQGIPDDGQGLSLDPPPASTAEPPKLKRKAQRLTIGRSGRGSPLLWVMFVVLFLVGGSLSLLTSTLLTNHPNSRNPVVTSADLIERKPTVPFDAASEPANSRARALIAQANRQQNTLAEAPNLEPQAGQSGSAGMDLLNAIPAEEEKQQQPTYTPSDRETDVQREIRRNGKITQRINAIRSAIASGNEANFNRNLGRLWKLLGRSHPYVTNLEAYWALRQGDHEEAEHLLHKVLKKSPDNLEAGANLVVLRWNRGDQVGAYQLLQRLQQSHPGDLRLEKLATTLKARWKQPL